MKKFLIILAILSMLLFGCIENPSSPAELTELQTQYSVQETYNPDLDIMNSYITELSLLRARSSGPFATTVDAELFTAQSFYYLSKALDESSQINYSGNFCVSKEYKNTLMYLEISENYSKKAQSSILAVLPTESNLLRKNQADLAASFNASAVELSNSLQELC